MSLYKPEMKISVRSSCFCLSVPVPPPVCLRTWRPPLPMMAFVPWRQGYSIWATLRVNESLCIVNFYMVQMRARFLLKTSSMASRVSGAAQRPHLNCLFQRKEGEGRRYRSKGELCWRCCGALYFSWGDYQGVVGGVDFVFLSLSLNRFIQNRLSRSFIEFHFLVFTKLS